MALKHVWMKLRDRLRFKWAKSKFDFVPAGSPDDFSFDSCHHVVVLKLDGKLGDTQVMTHFYSTLRAHIPHIFLSVVCSPNLEAIYRDVLGFDLVLTASRKPRSKEIQQLCSKIKAATRVSAVGAQEGSIDLVITTEPNFRPRDFIFNFELSPRYVAGCETKVDSVNLLLFDPLSSTKKVAVSFEEFMRRGGLKYDALSYTPLVTAESLQNMRRWLHLVGEPHVQNQSVVANAGGEQALNLRRQRFLLAINPRASSRSRSFTDEFTIKLMQELQAHFGAAHGLSYPHAVQEQVLQDVPHKQSDNAVSLKTDSGVKISEGNMGLSNSEVKANLGDFVSTDSSAGSHKVSGSSEAVEINEVAVAYDISVANDTAENNVTDSNVTAVADARGLMQHPQDQSAIHCANTESDDESKVSFKRDLEFVMLTPPQADELKAKIKEAAVKCGASVFFLPENSSPLDLASAIDLCDALISVDTAAVHMACASHCPQLCVYTGTDRNEFLRWSPLDQSAKIVRKEGVCVPDLPEDELINQAICFVREQI